MECLLLGYRCIPNEELFTIMSIVCKKELIMKINVANIKK